MGWTDRRNHELWSQVKASVLSLRSVLQENLMIGGTNWVNWNLPALPNLGFPGFLSHWNPWLKNGSRAESLSCMYLFTQEACESSDHSLCVSMVRDSALQTTGVFILLWLLEWVMELLFKERKDSCISFDHSQSWGCVFSSLMSILITIRHPERRGWSKDWKYNWKT